MSFGNYIRQLRKERGLTQQQLAEQLQALELQAGSTYISKIENTEDFTPSEEIIRGLAQIFEIEEEELLDRAGKFDQRAVQAAVAAMPEVGILLRRIGNGKISQQQVRRFLAEVNA